MLYVRGKQSSPRLKGSKKMKKKVVIKAVYSWFNVYIDNHLILTKLKNIDDLIKALHESNTPYDLRF